MGLYLDTFAYTNQLRSQPPEHKLLFAITVLAIALVSHPPVQIAIAFWMSIWILAYARIPFNIYWRLMAIAMFFLFTSLPALLIGFADLSNLLPIQSDIIYGIPFGSYYLYLSQNGFTQAGLILTRTISTVSCVYFILFTVPFTEILQTLRCLGLPTILTELLMLMYRFIFIFLSVASELWIAQQARNGYRTRQRWIYSLSLLISQMFHKTLQYYQQFLLSTAARGFKGEFRVWSSRRYHLSQRYAIEAALGCIVLALLNFNI
jgi:cobalt/nickel transport system permease protein